MEQIQTYHLFNPLTSDVFHHTIEISQLIYIANQLTCFYMMGKIDRWLVKIIDPFYTYVPFSIPLENV